MPKNGGGRAAENGGVYYPSEYESSENEDMVGGDRFVFGVPTELSVTERKQILQTIQNLRLSIKETKQEYSQLEKSGQLTPADRIAERDRIKEQRSFWKQVASDYVKSDLAAPAKQIVTDLNNLVRWFGRARKSNPGGA